MATQTPISVSSASMDRPSELFSTRDLFCRTKRDVGAALMEGKWAHSCVQVSNITMFLTDELMIAECDNESCQRDMRFQSNPYVLYAPDHLDSK